MGKDVRSVRDDKVQKRKLKAFSGILRYIFHYRIQVVFMLLAAIAGNLLALVVPRLTGDIIDSMDGGWKDQLMRTIVQGVLFIVLVSVVSWLLNVLQGRLMLYCAQNMVHRLRHDVFEKLMKLPVSYFDYRSKGDLISVVSTDIDNISETVSADLVTLISGVVTVSGALVMMLEISPAMTLIFAFTVPLMYFLAVVISRKARVLHRQRKDSLGVLTGYTEEMITAQKTVKVYGMEEYNTDRFAGYADDLREKGSRAEFQSSMMMPTMNGINNLNFTLVCIIGAFLALSGRISIGDISAFVQYSKRFANPIVESANIISMFQTSLAACDRVFAILNADEEKTQEDAEPAEKVKGAIEFRHVDFSYVKGTPILKNIDLKIKPGTCTAVVGATGSGKTTLISLLLRFYDVTGGRILLDGRDIRELPIAELRKSFALILQDSWIFEGTVYENIGYAAPKEKASHEEIEKMCSEIQIDSFIKGMRNGYNTILRNDTGSLSQGQKQLFNIARAFLCDPPIFILDEATSSVDPLLESKIQSVTDRVIRDKTSFVIAHRLSTVVNADNILVMKDGEIKESGTHEELLAQNGLYSTLYESQFAQSSKAV